MAGSIPATFQKGQATERPAAVYDQRNERTVTQTDLTYLSTESDQLQAALAHHRGDTFTLPVRATHPWVGNLNLGPVSESTEKNTTRVHSAQKGHDLIL